MNKQTNPHLPAYPRYSWDEVKQEQPFAYSLKDIQDDILRQRCDLEVIKERKGAHQPECPSFVELQKSKSINSPK